METLTIQYDGKVYRAFDTKRKQLYLGSSNSLEGLFQKSSPANKSTPTSTPTNHPVIELSVCGNRITAICEGQGVTVDEDYSSNRYHNIKHALELIERQRSYPKVGDPYYYVYFGEDSKTVGRFEVRDDRLRKAQVDYYNRYHKLPLNVYSSQNQAVVAMERISACFKDLCGGWEFNELG